MMKRLSLILILLSLAVVQQVHMQYCSVNYDAHTVAAMATAFDAEVVAESYYRGQINDILKHYNAAEVVTAGIFASKLLEHKAFSDLGIWGSSAENYYYRHVYRMVLEKIMPKVWVVAELMLRSPRTTIYWGGYLMEICDETRSLCMQFESVVTNNTLGFSNVVFPEINRNIAPLLELSEVGNIDWQRMLDDLTNVPGSFTRKNLQHDIDNLCNMGVGLASTDIGNISDVLLRTSSFHDLVGGRVSKIVDLYDHYGALSEQAEHDLGDLLIDTVDGEDSVARLFDLSNYDLTSWMTDYLDRTAGSYYTQQWYIARREQGSIALYDYCPPTDDNSMLNGGEWARFEMTDPGFYPNASQQEQVLANSGRYVGWSRSRAQLFNSQGNGYTYTIDYWQNGYIISRGDKRTKKAYVYEIHVKKGWSREGIIYGEVFDSCSVDLGTLKMQLSVRSLELNDNEEDYTCYVASGARNYYQATGTTKLQDCEGVTISVTCSGGVTLGQGMTQYECRKCGESLNAHSKGCIIRTAITESELDLSELDAVLQEAGNQMAALQSQINALGNENVDLLKKIAETSVRDVAMYRQQYNTNKTQIDRLKNELSEWQKEQREYTDAGAEAADDNDVATDDYCHIPAIMQDYKTAYSLSWQDGETWNGYTYVRKATIPNISGIITFKATISVARKSRCLPGIKIHHAIVQTNWELTTRYTDTYVADALTLDPNLSDAEKTKLVNDRIAEIARGHPSCKITAEYARTPSLEETPTGEVYHLLWSSDRLEITRGMDSRIARIYADLVSLGKMMHCKRSIIDMLEDVLPELDMDKGRRLALVEECHKRQVENARNLRNGNGEDSGKEVRP